MATPSSQYNALESFYTSTSGGNWIYPSGTYQWTFDTSEDPCLNPWEGLTCNYISSSNTYDIVSINLPGFNLVGTLPSDLSGLSALNVLDLRNNFLSSHIPESISTMTALKVINLGNNQLMNSGSLDLSLLTNLEIINLQGNRFEGNIENFLPSQSANNLTVIDISMNKFSGSLPAVLTSYSASLIYLNIGVNCIDLDSFEDDLKNIICNVNQLEQLIAPVIDGNCRDSALKIISPHRLRRRHQINLPQCLFTLPYISTINLAGNGIESNLEDDLPTSLSSSLIKLDFYI